VRLRHAVIPEKLFIWKDGSVGVKKSLVVVIIGKACARISSVQLEAANG
jgi:hypothetical protein